MKCTVNQTQSTASPLSGEVIKILVATAYVSFVQDVPTAVTSIYQLQEMREPPGLITKFISGSPATPGE